MIEYVLIANVNDSLEAAAKLGELLQVTNLFVENKNENRKFKCVFLQQIKGKPCIVNVIPYNPTDVPHDYKTPDVDTREKFCDKVISNEKKNDWFLF